MAVKRSRKTTKKETKKKIDSILDDVVGSIKIKGMDASTLKRNVKVVSEDKELDEIPYRIPFKNYALQTITGGIIGGTFCEIAGESQCLAKGTLVATPKGPVKIEDLKVGDKVFGYNKDGSISVTTVKEVFETGRKKVFELRNKHNVFNESTLDHVWGCYNVKNKKDVFKECKLSELRGKSEIRVLRKYVDYTFGNKNEKHAYAVGAMLGDGCSKQGVTNIHISSPDNRVPKKVKEILGAKFCVKQKGNYTYVISNAVGKGKTGNKIPKIKFPVYDKYIKGKYAHEKELPLEVFSNWNRESLLNLIAGLIDTDGSVVLSKGKYLTLSFSSTSKKLAELYSYLIYLVFQVKPRLHIDTREGRRNCFEYKIGDNFTVARILKTLKGKIVTPSKSYKPSYSKLPQHLRSDCVGIKTGKSRTVKTYDIHVSNETNLYVLHSGLVTHNSGKSFLAYELMATCQEMGGFVSLNDGERAFEKSYGKMVGLDMDKGTFVYTTIADINKVFAFWSQLIEGIRKKNKKAPILLVQDSFPTMITSMSIENIGKGDALGYEAMQRNQAFSREMEKFVGLLKDKKATLIILNQFTKDTNAGLYENPYKSLCEEKMQYYATQRLKGMLGARLTKTIKVNGKDVKTKTGVKTTWETIKNRAVKPFQKATVAIRYAKGIEETSGLLKLLMDTEKVTTGTSKFVNGEELSKAVPICRIPPHIADTDFVIEYKSKTLEPARKKEIYEMIDKFPAIIEPIWTGTYDDGEDDEVIFIGGEEDENSI